MLPSVRQGMAIAFMPRRLAKALGIETKGLKKVIFNILKSHQFDSLDYQPLFGFDVSIQPIANSRTTKITLLRQLAAIFTGIFGQNLQLLQKLTLWLQHCSRPIFHM